MNARTLPMNLERIVRTLWSDLGTPLAQKLSEMMTKGDWNGIAAEEPDPRSYQHAGPYLLDAQATAILRKFEPLPTTHDREASAFHKWVEGERQCFLTNARLSKFISAECMPHGCTSENDLRILRIFRDVRKVIRELIGSGPSLVNVDGVTAYRLDGRFGPGSTYLVRGGRSTVPHKMSSIASTTRAAWREMYPHWVTETQWGRHYGKQHDFVTLVRGNRFTTVPKNCKVHRSIAMEPCLNVFYQLAVGGALRSALKQRTGWDLGDAQKIHRQVACESSRSREFATLDLSNASDTVSLSLVELLLPAGWLRVLKALRSPMTFVPKSLLERCWARALPDPEGSTLRGRWFMLEKFSSMGNGFTFELETIIFAALSIVASREAGYKGRLGEDVFVYGDDIIVKESVVEPLVPFLSFCGFSLNREKSFSGPDVPFRESCGGDFFNGIDVRPYFLKEDLCGPADYIAFANGLNRLDQKLTQATDRSSRRAWFRVLDCIPTGVRSCRGPEYLGDLVIHDRRQNWSLRARNDGQRLYCRVYRPVRPWRVLYKHFSPEVVLACAIYGCGTGVPTKAPWVQAGVIPRDSTYSYKIGWHPVVG